MSSSGSSSPGEKHSETIALFNPAELAPNYVNASCEKTRKARCSKHSKRARCLVEEAEVLMDAWTLTSPFSVEALADRLQVSKRTLYRAFHIWRGVGPYEVFLSKKLHAFRKQLLRGISYRGKITDVAISTGFDHFGRLAERYRDHFGELPIETARRKKG